MSGRPEFPRRSPDSGGYTKLVLAFHLGASFSDISFCSIYPTRGLELEGGNSRIQTALRVPAVILYDNNGDPKVFGGKAMDEKVRVRASENGWVECKWFMFHLSPTVRDTPSTEDLLPLPPGKTAVEVLSDYLRYLFLSAKAYLEDQKSGFPEDQLDVVFSVPNSWDERERFDVLRAIMKSGMVYSPERVHFVSKVDMNLSFCFLHNPSTVDSLQEQQAVTLVDLTGITIEVTTYARDVQAGSNAQRYSTVAPPQWRFKPLLPPKSDALIADILEAIDNQIKASIKPVKTAFLIEDTGLLPKDSIYAPLSVALWQKFGMRLQCPYSAQAPTVLSPTSTN